VGKQATSRAHRSVAREGTARRARGPPVRYRDKPAPTPERDPFVRRSTGHGEEMASSGKILLPPAARLKNQKRPFPLRTKNCQHTTQNNRLTGKAPYRFEGWSVTPSAALRGLRSSPSSLPKVLFGSTREDLPPRPHCRLERQDQLYGPMSHRTSLPRRRALRARIPPRESGVRTDTRGGDHDSA
jgi:hypothetical protein